MGVHRRVSCLGEEEVYPSCLTPVQRIIIRWKARKNPGKYRKSCDSICFTDACNEQRRRVKSWQDIHCTVSRVLSESVPWTLSGGVACRSRYWRLVSYRSNYLDSSTWYITVLYSVAKRGDIKRNEEFEGGWDVIASPLLLASKAITQIGSPVFGQLSYKKMYISVLVPLSTWDSRKDIPDRRIVLVNRKTCIKYWIMFITVGVCLLTVIRRCAIKEFVSILDHSVATIFSESKGT